MLSRKTSYTVFHLDGNVQCPGNNMPIDISFTRVKVGCFISFERDIFSAFKPIPGKAVNLIYVMRLYGHIVTHMHACYLNANCVLDSNV